MLLMLDAMLFGNFRVVPQSFESRFIHKRSCGRFYGEYDMLWSGRKALYPRFRVSYSGSVHQDNRTTYVQRNDDDLTDGGATSREHHDGVRTKDPTPPGRLKMTVQQTASYLGISAEAVRARIQRGTLEHTKEDGKVYVAMDRPDGRRDERHNERTADRTDDRLHHHDDVRTFDQTALISELRDHNQSLRSQVEHLRGELEVRNEEARRKDTIIMSLTQRVPEVEAPAESRGAPEADTAPSRGARDGGQARNVQEGQQEPQRRRSGLMRFFWGP
jgi:hypothetical protein